jgi:hypothetical protein
MYGGEGGFFQRQSWLDPGFMQEESSLRLYPFFANFAVTTFPARSKQKLLTAKIAKGGEDRKERRLSREFFGAT